MGNLLKSNGESKIRSAIDLNQKWENEIRKVTINLQNYF